VEVLDGIVHDNNVSKFANLCQAFSKMIKLISAFR
jgi:hypothetical protein